MSTTESLDDNILDNMLPSIQPASPTSFSSLCKIYDALLDALWKDQECDVGTILGNKELMLRRQVDHLQALRLICRFLIGILDLQPPQSTPQAIPATQGAATNKGETSIGRSKQQMLEQTLARGQLLIQVLYQRNPGLTRAKDTQDDEIRVMPYKDYEGLYSFTFAKDAEEDDSDDDENLLNLDRKVLEQEEQALLEMANTPVPAEGRDCHPAEKEDNSHNMQQEEEDSNLQSQLQSEWTRPVYQECQERRKRQRLSK